MVMNWSRKESIIATLIVVAMSSIESETWSYDENKANGPHSWAKDYPEYCSKENNPRQSPIDIKAGYTTYDPTLKPVTFSGFDAKGVIFQVINNGHTVQYKVLEGKDTIYTSGGPGGNDVFRPTNLHLHWGSPTSGGSEHTVLGSHHSGEIHILEINDRYKKLSTASIIEKPDGVLGIAIFFDVATKDNAKTPNTEFSKLTGVLSHVQDKFGAKKNLTRGYLNMESLLPTNRSKYYTYLGGLSTPDCNGAVIWLVYKDPIYIAKDQFEALFKVNGEDGKPLLKNIRPAQPLGDRKVRSSFQTSMASSKFEVPSVIGLVMGLFLLINSIW